MYKVSFTDDFKKVERFNNKVTKVTLSGVIRNIYGEELIIPPSISNWMADNMGRVINIIEVTGTAVRNNKDKDDPVLGERLAEARAKLKIYKLMKTFCNKMLKYYKFKLYGTKANNEIIVKTGPEELSCNDSLLKAYMKYDKLVNVENNHIKQLLYNDLLNNESNTKSSQKH